MRSEGQETWKQARVASKRLGAGETTFCLLRESGYDSKATTETLDSLGIV